MTSVVRIGESAGHFSATALDRRVDVRLKLGSDQVEIGVNMRRPGHKALLRAKTNIGGIARGNENTLALDHDQASPGQEGYTIVRTLDKPSLLVGRRFEVFPPDRTTAK